MMGFDVNGKTGGLMKIEFTKRNKNKVYNAILAAEEGRKLYKKLSPAEWHQFVQNYNYDNGLEPFVWLAKQPECDKGTALCLYWYLQPDYYKGDVPKDDINYPDYALIKDIEKRFLSGFYQNEQFSFDPTLEFLTDKTDVRHIPVEMTQKTQGIPFERLNVEFAFLRYPNEKEKAVIAKKVANALAIMEQANIAFDAEDPDSVVKAIEKTVFYYKELDAKMLETDYVLGEKAKAKYYKIDSPHFFDLSFLWIDCVNKKYNWDFAMWDSESFAEFCVTNDSRTRTLRHGPFRLMLNGYWPIENIAAVYFELGDLRKKEFLSSSTMQVLDTTFHLKFRES